MMRGTIAEVVWDYLMIFWLVTEVFHYGRAYRAGGCTYTRDRGYLIMKLAFFIPATFFSIIVWLT